MIFFKNKIHSTLLILILITILLGAILILMPDRASITKPKVKPQPTRTEQITLAPTPTATVQKRTSEPVSGSAPPSQTREPISVTTIHTEKTIIRTYNSKMAIVIDDAGYSTILLKPFLLSKAKLSIAVLPGLPHTTESAQMIASTGKEVLLHLPMEALNGNNPGPGAIYTSDTNATIRNILEEDFAAVPQAKGTNNHMGSKATNDPQVMNTIMEYLSRTGRFFLDSKTTASYLPIQYAKEYKVPYISRDVFLDNEVNKEYITNQFKQGMALCLAYGNAVLIGHVQNVEVIEVINEFLPKLQSAGIELVYVSELL